MEISVNGQKTTVTSSPDTPLLWVLRDELNLTGTKFGCGKGLCGACTVHVDGQPTRSCSFAVKDAEGMEVTTIEGVKGKVATAVQKAWVDHHVPQCGYCQSGQVMTTCALLTEKPKVNDSDIDAALGGHICRCGTYQRIRSAVHQASQEIG